jgi:L-serine dehydratase
MNIFDIIGPIMIGPSSSHTAGAVRIGRVSRKLLGEPAVKAEIGLGSSFAYTYKGHGTDKALIAGILGLGPEDERIRESLLLAATAGLQYSFRELNMPRAHPNTVKISLTGTSGHKCEIVGTSVGGGNILINRINGMDTAFSCENDTLVVLHRDAPGAIAGVTAIVADSGVNICNFRLSRQNKGGEAVMTIEVDGIGADRILETLKEAPMVIDVIFLYAN